MNSTPVAPDSTLHRAVAGYRTTFLAQGVRIACKIGGLVILARLVAPAEHGVFAMAASVTFLLALFRDLGAGPVAIQAPSLTPGQETALCWMMLALGAGLFAATLLLAPVAVAFYDEPRLSPLLALLGGGFVLSGANAWPRAWLARHLRFTELNILETAGAVAGTAAMIVTGLFGAGAFAFAWFVIVSEGVVLGAAWFLCPWRPRAPADWAGLRQLGRLGLNLTGYHLLLYCAQQGGVLLMGRWFGAVPVGTYNRTSQFLAQPVVHIATPFSQVLLATLSRLGPGSADFVRHFREATTVVAHCTLPFAAAALVLAGELVWVLLGSSWLGAEPMLRWVALNAAATFPTATLYALAVSGGRMRALIQATAATVAAIFAGLWFGAAHGALGMAAGVALANLILLVPQLWWVSRRTALTLRDLLDSLLGPLGVSLALATGFTLGRAAASGGGPLLRLTAGGFGGALAAGACYLAWPRLRLEGRTLLSYMGRRPTAPSAFPP